MGLQSST